MQVLLWRPAELLNGRLAMIGFTAAIANEAVTGASLWQQLYYAPYAYLSAYLLVVAAAQLNRAFGSPNKGVVFASKCKFAIFDRNSLRVSGMFRVSLALRICFACRLRTENGFLLCRYWTFHQIC